MAVFLRDVICVYFFFSPLSSEGSTLEHTVCCNKKKSVWLGAVAQAYNPRTLGGWGGWITRSRDWDHAGQQGETPSLLKIQKLAGHGGTRL